MQKCWSIGVGWSPQLGSHLPPTVVVGTGSVKMVTVVRGGNQSKWWGGDVMVSQLMRAEKLCLALETSVSIRTKSSKLKEASLFRESQSAFHTCDKYLRWICRCEERKAYLVHDFRSFGSLLFSPTDLNGTEHHMSAPGRTELLISWWQEAKRENSKIQSPQSTFKKAHAQWLHLLPPGLLWPNFCYHGKTFWQKSNSGEKGAYFRTTLQIDMKWNFPWIFPSTGVDSMLNFSL